MLKKTIIILMSCCLLLFSSSCSSNKSTVTLGDVLEDPIVVEPELAELKSITELSALECYYHRVIKYKKEDADKVFGFTDSTGKTWGLGNKDLHFWLEYDCEVKIGLDGTLVTMSVLKDKVTITLPEPHIISIREIEDSYNSESFILAKGSADITPDDMQIALKIAEEELRELVYSDQQLFQSALDRAKSLLKTYIDSVGDATNVEFEITWEYIDSQGNPL